MSQGPMVAAILAGGSGKRFWPLSVADEPKQFLRLEGDETLLQAAWRRLEGLVPPERRLVITSEAFADRVRADLPDLAEENLIGEPEQRDTAPASILGAALALKGWPGSVVLTMPADHLISPAAEFRRLVAHAADLAEKENVLCTIGIRPTYPSDAYGYIERGDELAAGGGLKAFRVRRFAEKPDQGTAAEYLKRGTFYWNAGVFIWPAGTLLAEAREHLPEHAGPLAEAADAWRTPRWADALRAAYAGIERISVDYGIMERTGRAAVVEAVFDWSDVGGWLALGDLLPADEAANRVRGATVLHDCCGNVVYNAGDRQPTICIGLKDTVVVHTEHGVLVCPKGRVQEIKAAVEALGRAPSPPGPQ